MNLVVLDEEDDIVQFAHHSVRSFFLETSDHTFEDFHFKLSDADPWAGEVCVTYLHFNCFKTQLMKTCSATKLKDQILISLEAILQSSLSSGLNRTVSSSWLKFGGLWKSRRADTTGAEIGLPVGAGIDSASSLKRLRTSRAFLAYASEFWLHHTRTFAKDKTQSWNLWVTLIHSEDNLAGLPWALDEWKMRSINMLEWISGHHHEGLLSLIQQCSTTNIPVESLRPLFPIIAAEARAEFLNILVQSQDGTIEDSETAMKMPLYHSSEQFSMLQAAIYQGDREIVE
jgi:hypothetical protein